MGETHSLGNVKAITHTSPSTTELLVGSAYTGLPEKAADHRERCFVSCRISKYLPALSL